MGTDIFIAGTATAVTEKTGQRTLAAGLQRAAEDVAGNAVRVSLHGAAGGFV
jgi:hypothetical protein